MKRFYMILIAFAVFLFSCSTLTRNNPTRPSQTYDDNGIKFEYSQDWEVISPSQLNIQVTDYTYLAVLADTDKSKGTIAQVVIVQTEKSFSEYIIGEREYRNDHYKNNYTEKRTSVDGNTAIQFESNIDASSETVNRSMEIYFEYNDTIYYILFVTKSSHYAEVKPDFDMVIDSFDIVS